MVNCVQAKRLIAPAGRTGLVDAVPLMSLVADTLVTTLSASFFAVFNCRTFDVDDKEGKSVSYILLDSSIRCVSHKLDVIKIWAWAFLTCVASAPKYVHKTLSIRRVEKVEYIVSNFQYLEGQRIPNIMVESCARLSQV